ncbi:hypothetical protein AGOR_G00202520 [Albula goreensis]|uniref:Transcription factor AP-2 C-terminal domain-containing protein n=2 Tax=Albula TaxID=54908 RepID=A0A8T3CXD0_9TELE|nr:hypothetical protein JZ751_008020 [Albula glossodonta]KAI1887088.1 hypothetical protein AGOR_G00202520 [Albula goreensis]
MEPNTCVGSERPGEQTAKAQHTQGAGLALEQALEQMVGGAGQKVHGVDKGDRPNGTPHEGGPSQGLGEGTPAEGSLPMIPFAEVVSLLDPNMKSTKARKYQIHYEEVKRRLDPPEKMSLRSLAAYTRVSRGPASKRTLLESLQSFGLAPSANTAVSSSFSKLTEGDTAALCRDMRDFASQYMNYDTMVKTLLPETNQVQHWSKIIETRNHLEEMRKCFHDPANSRTFDNVTHGFGTAVLDVAFDMIEKVIDKQIRVLSGNPEPEESQQEKRVRKRKARTKPDGEADGKAKPRAPKTPRVKGENKTKASKKQLLAAQEAAAAAAAAVAAAQDTPTDMESSVLTLVSVGYETISSGL